MPDLSLPKPGMRFEHSRFIQGSPKGGDMRPDICTVTRMARGVVYYSTETGMKIKAPLDQFSGSVGKWL